MTLLLTDIYERFELRLTFHLLQKHRKVQYQLISTYISVYVVLEPQAPYVLSCEADISFLHKKCWPTGIQLIIHL